MNKNSIVIKGIPIQSKLHFAPINTGLATNGQPTAALINFHKIRSGPNMGINYIGNIAISPSSVTNDGTLYIGDSLDAYSKLVEEIEVYGTLAGAQIGALNSEYTPLRNWKNKKVKEYFRYEREKLLNLSQKDIDKIINDFQVSILKLKYIGFKVIQLHAAHGYLLNRFITKTFNTRNDQYGLDPFLIIKEILNGISHEIKDVIIDIRISLFETSIQDNLNDQQTKFLEDLIKIEGINMISLSNGFYNSSKGLIYPSKKEKPNFMFEILEEFVKNYSEIHWNFSGNIRNISKLNINGNYHYSIGRPLLADEEFIEKAVNKEYNINKCLYKNQCHYYSRNKKSIECGVNKKLY